MLLANLNSSGTVTANVTISGFALDTSGSKWLYGQNQTTPLETPMPSGLGNSFSVSVPFRSIVALLIEATLQGDYNRDGTVDASDYVVWRKTLNQTVTRGSGADGDANGIIQLADLNIWRANFGATSGGGASTAVPEPSAAILATLAALACTSVRTLRLRVRRIF
jgi:hypothetical protein